MLCHRTLIVLVSLLVLPGPVSLADVLPANKENNHLIGLAYSNEKMGGCQVSHVAISETAAEIKLDGIMRTLPAHGMKVVRVPGTQEETVYFQIDMSEIEDDLWWTMVFTKVTTHEAADKEVDWYVQEHTGELSDVDMADALLGQPGRYFGRLSAC